VSFTQTINLGKRYVCKRGSQQWHNQPKNLRGAKKLGGPKCLILGE